MSCTNDFSKKQRHELALAFAGSVFNKKYESVQGVDAESLADLSSEFFEFYIFAYREYSNYQDSEFNSVPGEV